METCYSQYERLFSIFSKISDAMQPVLLALGWNELHVHPFLEDPSRNRRDGPVRHECVLRVSALVGNPARAICRYTGKRASTNPPPSAVTHPCKADNGCDPLRHGGGAPGLHGRDHGKSYVGGSSPGGLRGGRVGRLQGALQEGHRRSHLRTSGSVLLTHRHAQRGLAVASEPGAAAHGDGNAVLGEASLAGVALSQRSFSR